MYKLLIVGLMLFAAPLAHAGQPNNAIVDNLSELSCGEQEIEFTGSWNAPENDNSGQNREQYRLRVEFNDSVILTENNDNDEQYDDWSVVQEVEVGTHEVKAYVERRTSSTWGFGWTNWSLFGTGDTDEFSVVACEEPVEDVCDNLDGVQESVPDGYTESEGICTETPDEGGGGGEEQEFEGPENVSSGGGSSNYRCPEGSVRPYAPSKAMCQPGTVSGSAYPEVPGFEPCDYFTAIAGNGVDYCPDTAVTLGLWAQVKGLILQWYYQSI